MTAKQERRSRQKANRLAAKVRRAQALLTAWEATIDAATDNHDTHVRLGVRCVDCIHCYPEWR